MFPQYVYAECWVHEYSHDLFYAKIDEKSSIKTLYDLKVDGKRFFIANDEEGWPLRF